MLPPSPGECPVRGRAGRQHAPPAEARQALCLTTPGGTLRHLAEYPTARQREVGRIVAGVFVFARTIFDVCRRVEPSEEGEYELTDAVNVLIERKNRRVEALPLEGRRANVNTPDDLRRAKELVGAVW